MEENLERQDEELSALEAIFGDDCKVDRSNKVCEVYIPSVESKPHIKLLVHLPETYPSSSAPFVEVLAQHLSDDVVHATARDLSAQFNPGEVVLFEWVEWIKERSQLWEGTAVTRQSSHEEFPLTGSAVQDDEVADQKGKGAIECLTNATSSLQLSQEDLSIEIISGEPFTEKKSTFQAHVATVRTSQQVDSVMARLLQNNKIRNATHNIMAYRILHPETGSCLQDYDDDGETAAGGRLLHLLQVADARDVVVVVSRWFGGVLLGPARFTHINNTARILLEEKGYIQGARQARTKKKR